MAKYRVLLTFSMIERWRNERAVTVEAANESKAIVAAVKSLSLRRRVEFSMFGTVNASVSVDEPGNRYPNGMPKKSSGYDIAVKAPPGIAENN